MKQPTAADHREIWLQADDEDWIDPSVGRMWCEDKIWPDNEGEPEPVRYVRGDLYDELQAEVERLRELLRRVLRKEIVCSNEFRRELCEALKDD